MNDWNLEGKRVVGMYMGDFAVSGVVYLSRVKYGGGLTHHIKLDNNITVYNRVADHVILNQEELIKVL